MAINAVNKFMARLQIGFCPWWLDVTWRRTICCHNNYLCTYRLREIKHIHYRQKVWNILKFVWLLLFCQQLLKYCVFIYEFVMYILCVVLVLTKIRWSMTDPCFDPGVPQGDVLWSVKFDFLCFGPQNCKSGHRIIQATSVITICS